MDPREAVTDRAVAPLVVAVVGLLLLAGLILVAGLVMLAGWFTGTWPTTHMSPMPIVGFGGLLFWVVVAIVVVTLVARAGEEEGEADDAALEELRRAYARGDLTDDEYEARRERLTE